jgi:hypothetical protein
MPERAALVTALVMERPLCVDCIAAKIACGVAEVEAALARIGTVLVLHRHEMEHCRACGMAGVAFSLERPAD